MFLMQPKLHEVQRTPPNAVQSLERTPGVVLHFRKASLGLLIYTTAGFCEHPEVLIPYCNYV